MKVPGILPNLALGAAALLVTAGLLEAAARVYVTRALQGGAGTSKDPLLRFDPLLGWSKPPGERGVIERPEYRVELAINPRGLRGPERDYAKPAGARRVLLLGDSFVEGYTVDEDRTVRAELERLLAPDGPVEVLNGGTHGYSTDQELLFFEAEGRRYAPDEVVLLFYYNDLHGNVSGDGKPFFAVDAGALSLRNTPVPPPRVDERARRRTFTLRPFRGSMALRLLSNRTLAGRPELHRTLARAGLAEPAEEPDDPPQSWPFGPAHLREVDDMWTRTGLILRALDESVREAGGRLTVVYVPARFEVSDSAWDLTRRLNGWGPRWKRERVIERLLAVCGEGALRCVDPRPRFQAAEASGAETYFPQDGHWAPAGHRVAAEAIRDALSADSTKVP
jgi:acetyltransferase AlgX (SGNH hydrolase-like protein)